MVGPLIAALGSAAFAGPDWQAGSGTAPAGPLESFTVAPLVVRDEEKVIGVTGEELRVYLIEQIRALGGWPVYGMENVLFGKDRSAEARFVIGGEVQRLYDALHDGRSGTALDVRWQLLDRRRDEVVYEVLTRGWVPGAPQEGADDLVLVAMKNLLGREAFAVALAGTVSAPQDALLPLTLASCPASDSPLPKAFGQVLPGVIGIRLGGTTGSGVLVSPDGFALTAAHVVAGASQVGVKLHEGPELTADVIRVNVDRDVALIKLPGAGHPCLGLSATKPAVGEPVFVIGSPLGETFNGSVASGVFSGARSLGEGYDLLQTDAPTNPGNSGGPMLDGHGRVLGIMSVKIVGSGVEGIAFAVPAAESARTLAIGFGPNSDAVTPLVARAAGPLAPDEPDPIIGPAQDARVCLFRPTKTGLPYTLGVAGQTVELAPQQYACFDVPSGTVSVTRVNGVPMWTEFVPPGLTAYGRVGTTGITQSSKASFDAATALMKEVSP